jgi:hypothetical protein
MQSFKPCRANLVQMSPRQYKLWLEYCDRVERGELTPETNASIHHSHYMNLAFRQRHESKAVFMLSLGDFTRIVMEPCYVCGRPADVKRKQYVREETPYRANFLGRIKPNMDWTAENCVALCKHHNEIEVKRINESRPRLRNLKPVEEFDE